MGRLSEYDDLERARLAQVRKAEPVHEPHESHELIIGRSPVALRFEDATAKEQDFYAKLASVLSPPKE